MKQRRTLKALFHLAYVIHILIREAHLKMHIEKSGRCDDILHCKGAFFFYVGIKSYCRNRHILLYDVEKIYQSVSEILTSQKSQYSLLEE